MAPLRRGAAAAAAGLLLAAAALLQLAAPAAAHGVLIQPRSRNWNAYLDWGFNYAHGLSMGGALGPRPPFPLPRTVSRRRRRPPAL
jgi:hypothetical protein